VAESKHNGKLERQSERLCHRTPACPTSCVAHLVGWCAQQYTPLRHSCFTASRPPNFLDAYQPSSSVARLASAVQCANVAAGSRYCSSDSTRKWNVPTRCPSGVAHLVATLAAPNPDCICRGE